uniref:Uncharacterized protein n=1 Tax=Cacopsylla melanoneura TaxID=428564 RepID=A0A8D8V7Z8_9HEMI
MPNLPEIPPPLVAWAQRNHCIFLTICLEDCKNPSINIDKDQFVFDGIGGTEQKLHHVTIPFYKEINAELMRSMGGLMGDSSEKPNFDDLDPQSDSDDEDIPELEE